MLAILSSVAPLLVDHLHVVDLRNSLLRLGRAILVVQFVEEEDIRLMPPRRSLACNQHLQFRVRLLTASMPLAPAISFLPSRNRHPDQVVSRWSII